MKKIQCEKVEIDTFLIELEQEISQEELIEYVELLNNRDKITAILIQLPLPSHIDERGILNKIKIAGIS